MTKVYALLILSFCTCTLHAQINKGAVLLGGQLSYYQDNFQYENANKQKMQGGTIELSVGRAYKENSVAGLSLNYSPAKQNNLYNISADTLSTKSSLYGIGAFYRHYINLGKDFYFITQAAGGANFGKSTQTYKLSGEVKEKLRGAFVSLTPGISYQAFKRMQLEVTLPGLLAMQYLNTKTESKNTQIMNSERRQFVFSSNLLNSNSLGYMGVGFRFVL